MTEQRWAIYARISLDKKGQAVGVTRQVKTCRELIPAKYRAAAVEYIDNDRSAYSGRTRPAYERLLTDIEAGTVTHVAAWASDRLYRRMQDLIELTSAVERHAVTIRTCVDGDVDLTTAAGIMRAQIMGSVAEHESRRKGDRVAEARADDADRGLYLSTLRPYGWTRTDTVGHWLPHPEEGPRIAEAAALLLDGWSLRSIARRWPDDKMDPRSWGRTLRNPRHAGLISYKGAIVADAADGQRLIDPNTWRQVDAILSNPKRRTNGRSGSGRRPTRALSGFVICGLCGHHMNTSTYKGTRDRSKVSVRLMCPPTQHLTRRYELVADRVLDLAAGRIARNRERLTARAVERAEQLAEHNGEGEHIKELSDRLAALATLAAEGALAPEDYAAAAKPIRRKLEQMHSAADTRPGANPALRAILTVPDDELRGRLDNLADEDPEALRDLLRGLMKVTVVRAAVTTHPTADDIEVEWV